MQHYIGGLSPQVVPFPDHVAQVVIHVLVGVEPGYFGLDAKTLGQCLADVDIDPLAVK